MNLEEAQQLTTLIESTVKVEPTVTLKLTHDQLITALAIVYGLAGGVKS